MRTASEVHSDLRDRFKQRTQKDIRRGGVIDQIFAAESKIVEDAYIEIENNKNPHIWTNLDSVGLDRTGYFVNIPRQENESDNDYMYRIMNWTYTRSTSNITAITDALLNMKYASDAQPFPGIYGAGTISIYIIPKEYSEETIQNAIQEAKERLSYVVDPATYIEYKIPKIKPVKFIAQISSMVGDIEYLKTSIEKQVHDYVNAIAPKDTMSIGKINKIGMEMANVDYFNVIMTYIDDESKTDIFFLQDLDTKFLFDEIIWETITND